MKNLYKILQASLFSLLIVCLISSPSFLFAQIVDDFSFIPQSNQTNPAAARSPIVIFKIEAYFSASFYENHLIIDLPEGASLQYNGEGNFQINNMPDEHRQYNIKLRTSGNLVNGVTTADILLIQRYILGYGDLFGEFGLIAADVNCDGRITAKDMVDIRRVILGKVDKFGCDTNFTFYPNSLDFNWEGNTIDLGVFYPIKLGDINRNAIQYND